MQSVAEMTESLDIDCSMNLLAKQAVEIAQKTGTLIVYMLCTLYLPCILYAEYIAVYAVYKLCVYTVYMLCCYC